MLNIFADALVIATRLGRLSEGPRPTAPRFEDRDGLRTAEMLRNLGR